MQFFIGTLLTLSSLFLIALVLIQQGKGGGLAGAFGGMGGQSAFGTKAGDVFTRVTIITALVWIFFCMLAIKLIGKDSGTRRNQDSKVPPPVAAPATPALRQLAPQRLVLQQQRRLLQRRRHDARNDTGTDGSCGDNARADDSCRNARSQCANNASPGDTSTKYAGTVRSGNAGGKVSSRGISMFTCQGGMNPLGCC